MKHFLLNISDVEIIFDMNFLSFYVYLAEVLWKVLTKNLKKLCTLKTK